MQAIKYQFSKFLSMIKIAKKLNISIKYQLNQT